MKPKQMKSIPIPIWILLCCLLVGSFGIPSFAEAQTAGIAFSQEETAWLEANRDRILKLGLDPYSGMDYFVHFGMTKGYVVDFVDLLKARTGLEIEIIGDKSWSEVYQGLQDGQIDILFGANVTEERLRFMRFTEPIHQYPYAMIALKDSTVMTIGDADGRRLGFLEDDIAIEAIPKIYSKINYVHQQYPSQEEAVKALIDKEIDAFITNGGSGVDLLTYDNPELKSVAQFKTITSDMTFSTLKNNVILTQIIDKVILSNKVEIDQMVKRANYEFNWVILDLSEREVDYLNGMTEPIKVAVSNDYLPFEYVEDNGSVGIFVAYCQRLSEVLGIDITFVGGDFNTLYDAFARRELQIMNLAKTDERQKLFLYTDAYSDERDVIFGHKDAPYVGDIYGLENQRVAVVEGYYQYDYLEKNLNRVEWIICDSLEMALKTVNNNKADFIIENPTVVQYYIDELKLYNLSLKGDAGSDSYLYLTLTPDMSELLPIVNKALPLIDYNQVKNDALAVIPHLGAGEVTRLLLVILALISLLLIGGVVIFNISKKLIDERTRAALLEERQKFIHLDPLTQLKNRQFYSDYEEKMEHFTAPQAVLVADLNSLKRVNDTFGHHMGDEYILQFAEIIKKVLPQEALMMRMGGDEFLMIINDSSFEQAQHYIREIHKECEKAPFYKGLALNEPWVSIGVAIRTQKEVKLHETIQAADDHMYAQKNKYKER